MPQIDDASAESGPGRLTHERMRWEIDAAFRALQRAEIIVHKFYGQTDRDSREATAVQNHLHTAHVALKMALDELGESDTD